MSGGSRRAWGWHPLVDTWAERVVADAAIRPGDLVFDIGAGTGALTGHLLDTGARVIAVELHSERVCQLRQRFAGRPLSVLHIDARCLRLPSRPFRVVANPPYAISGALLRLLLGPRSPLVAADLVLQRAVVRRYVDQPPRWASRWNLTTGRTVPRRAFRPPPQVDSAVLVVRRVNGRPTGH